MIRTIILAAGFLAGSALMAQMGPIESLVERSPFLPPGYRAPVQAQPNRPTPPPAAPASARYELVGVVANEGKISVSLRRRGTPRGEWLAPGEMIEDVRFVRFDLAAREAVVETGGRRETIALKSPSVTGQAPPPVAVNQNRQQPQVTPAAQPNRDNKPRVPVRRRVIVSPSQK